MANPIKGLKVISIASLIIFSLSAFTSIAGEKSVYTWVDENGVRHYSDTISKGGDKLYYKSAKQVKIRAGRQAPSQVSDTEKKGNDLEQIKKEIVEELSDTVIVPDDQLAAKIDSSCITARENVENLSSDSRLAVKKDSSGNNVLLNETETNKELLKAKIYLEKYCQ